jgi:hypothetical protein
MPGFSQESHAAAKLIHDGQSQASESFGLNVSHAC